MNKIRASHHSQISTLGHCIRMQWPYYRIGFIHVKKRKLSRAVEPTWTENGEGAPTGPSQVWSTPKRDI